MFKIYSKSMDLKKKGFLINPIKYKFSINCSPNETNYYAITQNKNPKLYNSRNNFYPNNYTSQNLDYSNNLNNQDFFTEKVKRIINKETEGTITLDEILSKTTIQDHFRPYGYPYFSFSNRNLRKNGNSYNKKKIYEIKNLMGNGERKLIIKPSAYITNNKNGNDNYEGAINGPLFLNDYNENNNNCKDKNNRYDDNVELKHSNEQNNENNNDNSLNKSEKSRNLIPIKPSRLTYCNLTSVKYNIISPLKKSIFKTHDEVTEYKINTILNSPIKYGNNNLFNSTNFNESFTKNINKMN